MAGSAISSDQRFVDPLGGSALGSRWKLCSDCDSIVEMGVPKRDTVRGRAIAARRKVREYAMVTRALASTSHPVLAQIVPMRFCNLSCGYCNEYDKVSKPVPLDEMNRRIDHLGGWGRP